MQTQSHGASALIPFQFETHPVRVTVQSGEPWFALRDVATALDIKNVAQLAGQLNVKGVCKTYTPTPGGSQELTYVNEPNLYRVIFRSNKPEASRFQEWVFGEVLPAIRKTGSYTAQPHHAPILDIFATGRWIADVNEAGWPQLTRIPDDAVFAFPDDPVKMAQLIDDVPMAVLPDVLKAAAARLAGGPLRLAASRSTMSTAPTVERLVRYVRNAERYAGDRKYTAPLLAGVMPYAKALKLMKIDAEAFRALVRQAVETGALTVRRAPELGYPGEVLVVA